MRRSSVVKSTAEMSAEEAIEAERLQKERQAEYDGRRQGNAVKK